MLSLLEEVAAVIADLDQLEISNDDSMRQTKRNAKAAAVASLREAAQAARRQIEIIWSIDWDREQEAKDRGQRVQAQERVHP